MYRSVYAIMPAFVFLVVVGCANDERPKGGGAAATDSAPGGVTATEVRAPALETAIKEQRGKVVLIDCWATWCSPCVKKFPHLVELHKKYAEKGLVCMSLSMDKFGDEDVYSKEKVLKFLREKGAAFPNFIVTEPKRDEEPLLKMLGDFSGIPFMVMFDRTGRKVWDSSDKPRLNDEQLDKKIEEQLSEKP
jgi:thiol-disulfide isomerase/thioredoxin